MRSLFRQQKVKETDKWDGSADNYSSVQRYAAASLLNFNIPAGIPKDEWTKDLIALPIRGEGDSSDTFIKQAILDASGGMGITRVKKPEGVNQDVFNNMIRGAAKQIVRAYEEWGGVAPDSVFTLAGLPVPKERLVAFIDVFSQVLDALTLSDVAEETFSVLIDVYYNEDTDEFFALGLRDGRIVKMNFTVSSDGTVMLGEFDPVIEDNAPEMDVNLSVFRSVEGKKRWLAIASVATLNRVKEIDSRQLYDSFIEFIRITNKYPVLNVYHLGKGSRVGIADFVARDNYVYIATGTFDDNPFGETIYRTLEKNPGKWGNSIEFDSILASVETFRLGGMNVSTTVHKAGINTGISIVLEKEAASVLTTITRGGIIMESTELRKRLLELFDGNEPQIDEFLRTVEQANLSASGRISRSIEDAVTEEVVEEVQAEQVEQVEEEVQAEEVQAEEAEVIEVQTEEATEETEIVLGETFVRDLFSSEEFQNALSSALNERLGRLEQRINALQVEQEQTREWVEDVPVAAKTKRRAVVSYRPRAVAAEANGSSEQHKTYADRAAETISEIFE
jgi:hypothetical protein